ncbi:hypothetical protein [Prevotellamassilia timonensis]|jgi:hypothetical protein|uniref:hypothetical protein n=1 Tax=Prevotellamassilia timonensis TaxID=1852370 RepID=UPI0023F4FC9B|nr:hypothetical protein [Prevotellamassilia timonensis]MDD7440706.1 hypothetical protein [Prevotellamassilia timonensis]
MNIALDNNNIETLSLNIPKDDIKLLKDLVKKFGWKINRKKKTGLEEAMDDIKHGRVYGPYDSVDEMFKSMGVHV